MGPETIAFMAVIFGGSLAITYVVMDFVHKMVKAKNEAKNGASKEFKTEIEKLAASNANLRKRIETLEAIVVDADAEKLNTSFNSYLTTDSPAHNPPKQRRSEEDVQF